MALGMARTAVYRQGPLLEETQYRTARGGLQFAPPYTFFFLTDTYIQYFLLKFGHNILEAICDNVLERF